MNIINIVESTLSQMAMNLYKIRQFMEIRPFQLPLIVIGKKLFFMLRATF